MAHAFNVALIGHHHLHLITKSFIYYLFNENNIDSHNHLFKKKTCGWLPRGKELATCMFVVTLCVSS